MVVLLLLLLLLLLLVVVMLVLVVVAGVRMVRAGSMRSTKSLRSTRSLRSAGSLRSTESGAKGRPAAAADGARRTAKVLAVRLHLGVGPRHVAVVVDALRVARDVVERDDARQQPVLALQRHLGVRLGRRVRQPARPSSLLTSVVLSRGHSSSKTAFSCGH